ncbi:MAG: hypothetical protein KFF50_13335 [Desulfatitalea sp.]|nr:hypothetical protein [Desulfatitalea sp.]
MKSLMQESPTFPTSKEIQANAYIDSMVQFLTDAGSFETATGTDYFFLDTIGQRRYMDNHY